MAQDPERDDELQDEGLIDPSHDLDMVSVYDSQTIDSDVEAEVIRGITGGQRDSGSSGAKPFSSAGPGGAGAAVPAG